MADEKIRAGLRELKLPTFEKPTLTPAPPLVDATVAIVTTAGLRKPGDKGWKPNDSGFRVFDADDRDIKFGHLSPNLDYSGIAVDLNVAYPIDRLHELAEQGVIGSVAPRHYSFMGGLDDDVANILKDSGKAVAQLLKEDDVDIALLTPV